MGEGIRALELLSKIVNSFFQEQMILKNLRPDCYRIPTIITYLKIYPHIDPRLF